MQDVGIRWGTTACNGSEEEVIFLSRSGICCHPGTQSAAPLHAAHLGSTRCDSTGIQCVLCPSTSHLSSIYCGMREIQRSRVLGVLCFGWVLSGLLFGCSESAASHGFLKHGVPSPPHPSSPINGKVEGEWGSSEYIRAGIRPTFSGARFSAIPLSSTPIEFAPIQGGVFLC